jgi:hypothetical protein
MKRLLVLALLAVPALLVVGAPARADFIPWSYSFSVNPNPVTSNDGSASVNFATTSGTHTGSNDSFLATTLTGSGSTNAAFSSRGYTFTMHLTDLASSTSANLSWTGAFSGNSPFNLTNKVPNPNQTVTLGQHEFTATLGAFVPPVSGKAGSLQVQVIATTPNGGPVNQVPEPTSLLLAGVGLSALGARAWWRKRSAGARAISRNVDRT